jgi:hypothetical protein
MVIQYRRFRDAFLLTWLASNAAFVYYAVLNYRDMGFQSYLHGMFFYITVITSASIAVRLAGTIFYIFVSGGNKMRERRTNKKQLKTRRTYSGNIDEKKKSTARKLFDRTIGVIFVKKTWIAIFCVCLISPIFGILSMVYFWITLALLMAFSLTPAGPFVVAMVALSWRKLMKIEFSYNSFDGKFARMVGIESTNKAGAGTHVMPKAFIPIENRSFKRIWMWMRTILNDSFTGKSFVYMLYIKPLMLLLANGTSLLFLAVSLVTMFHSLLLHLISNYGCPNHLEFICSAIQIAPSYIYVSVPVGVLLLFLSLHLIKFMDKVSRQIVSITLADQIRHLKAASSGSMDLSATMTYQGHTKNKLSEIPIVDIDNLKE